MAHSAVAHAQFAGEGRLPSMAEKSLAYFAKIACRHVFLTYRRLSLAVLEAGQTKDFREEKDPPVP